MWKIAARHLLEIASVGRKVSEIWDNGYMFINFFYISYVLALEKCLKGLSTNILHYILSQWYLLG
jgi:hypothetical protein